MQAFLYAGLLVAGTASLTLDGRPAAGARSDDTIVITQEDLDALARKRGELNRPEGAADPAAEPPGPFDEGFDALYGYPFRDGYYWRWLETGALSAIADIEEEIDRLFDDIRETRRSRPWSEQLQREIDEIEDDIEKLETEREEALTERLTELEMIVGLSTAQKNEAGILCMTLAHFDLDAGRAKGALKLLDRARALLPDEPLVDLFRGIALRETGDNDTAREALLETLSIQPRMLLALIAMAQVEEDTLDYDDAAEFWKRAAEAPLAFPRGLERWANRNRQRYPEGESSLRRVWSDHFQLRLRLARLRDFAHRFYQSHEKPEYNLIYDPSIGVSMDSESVAMLRGIVRQYLEFGEGSVDRGEIARVFDQMRDQRDPTAFGKILSFVGDTLGTARRDVGRSIGHMTRDPAVVVLYNPAVWETLIASRSTLGVYRPLGRSISLYVSHDTAPQDLKDTIYHEYGHYVTLDLAGPRRLPLWLAEGLAEALALDSGYDRYAEDPFLKRWSGVWARDPVNRAWFQKGQEAFRVADYYKARRAVGVLESRFRWSGIADFLQALAGGADLDEASKKAFEMDYRDLQRFIVKRLPSWTGP